MIQPAVRANVTPEYVQQVISRGKVVGAGLRGRVAIDPERGLAVKYTSIRYDSLGMINKRAVIREGKVLSNIPPHPNIVGYVAHGEVEERAYVVMEYFGGQNLEGMLYKRRLSRFLRRREWVHSAFHVVRALSVTRKIALALYHLHSISGLLHADMGPSQVLIGNNDEVKLTDFDLARPIGEPVSEDYSGAGRGNVFWATPAYCSPNRLNNNAPIVRDDIFSLGMILGEMLFEGFVVKSADPGEIMFVAEEHIGALPGFIKKLRLPQALEVLLYGMLFDDGKVCFSDCHAIAEYIDNIMPNDTALPPPKRGILHFFGF